MLKRRSSSIRGDRTSRDRTGEPLSFVDTSADQGAEKAAKVTVDKYRQVVRLFDKSNALVAFRPATVDSEDKPSPSGILKETKIDSNPSYRCNPALQWRPFPQAIHHQAGH